MVRHWAVYSFRLARGHGTGPLARGSELHVNLVHCASGRRAGAFAVLYAAREGLSGEQALGEGAWLRLAEPELEDFVRRYQDQKR